MTLNEAIISGVVQGLTEFLPVSSSGHLVLLHHFFGISEPVMFFDICLHLGTLAAVLVYFRRDLIAFVHERRVDWLWCIVIGTIPVVIGALLFEKELAVFFDSPRKVAFMLFGTALFLFAGQMAFRLKAEKNTGAPGTLKAIVIGLAQMLALLPGMSRSGSTISTGLLMRMKAEDAFRFSLLLSIPAIMGAMVYEAGRGGVVSALSNGAGYYVAGIVTSFVVGYLSLIVLWKAIKAHYLYCFGIYCLLVGAAVTIF